MTQTASSINRSISHLNSFPFDTVKMFCSQHPSKNYVLFCVAQNCDTPICVDCEEQHSYEHEHQNTSENYISFSEYIRKQSQFLRNLLQKSKSMKQNITMSIRQERQQCLRIVNNHFDRLQKQVSQIKVQPTYLKQIEDNYKRIQDGQSCDIADHIFDDNIPQMVNNLTDLSEYLQNNIYIKPGIQIISDEVSEGRKRHHSQKIEYPKAYWVDDIAETEVKSQGNKTDSSLRSSQKLAQLMKGDLKTRGKAKSAFLENQAVNKGFQIRDEKPENLYFKADKAPKPPIPPNPSQAAAIKGSIQFRNAKQNPEV